jgi:putative ABC transport system permease protein
LRILILLSFLRTTPFGGEEDGGAGKLMMIIALIVLTVHAFCRHLTSYNINISRIMERSSEIACCARHLGALRENPGGPVHRGEHDPYLLGCVIGLALSFVILQIINSSDLISHMQLRINFTVLIFSILPALFSDFFQAFTLHGGCQAVQVVTALKAQ